MRVREGPLSSETTEKSTIGGGSFLKGVGETIDLVRSFDWAATPLGSIENWPQSLKTATSLILQSPVPIVMLWGPDGVMIYNDAYSVFAGARHPALLGSKVREGWPEVADFNDNVMKVGLAGGTLAYKDQELTLHRHGKAEQVWMNLDYSPVYDESGKPGGVIAIVVETTDRVLADRSRASEQERQRRLFEQAPGFIIIMRGPEHLVEFVNDAHRDVFNSHGWVGKTVREAFPSISDQGFFEQLDRVYATGETIQFQGQEVRYQRVPGGGLETRYLTFIYAPSYGDDGKITGIFCEGFDVTEGRLAEQALRASEERYRTLFDSIDEGFCILEFIPDERGPYGDYRYVEANPALAARSGMTDVLGRRVREILGEEAQDWIDIFASVHRSGDPLRFERQLGATGRMLELFAFRVEPASARQVGVLFQDVTQRHKGEQHLRLVINELNHRVKNNLAMTQAIAAQTFRSSDDLAQAQERFSARIMALAQANDLLTGERGAGVSLRGIVEQAIGPHRGEDHHCSIEGPDIQLSAKTALSLSLALHELSANALKYGAWSRPGGEVVFKWRTYMPAEKGERFHIEWREKGGPRVDTPARRGFGSRLIERGLAAEMGGQVEMQFQPEGLVCTIDAPLSLYSDA